MELMQRALQLSLSQPMSGSLELVVPWLSGAGVLELGQLGWSQPARIELPLPRQLARQPPLIN